LTIGGGDVARMIRVNRLDGEAGGKTAKGLTVNDSDLWIGRFEEFLHLLKERVHV